MKEHADEQLERMRQNLDDLQSELTVKEKELKKVKFEQLMIDTKTTFAQLKVPELNHTVRHATTYKPGNKKSKFDFDLGNDETPPQKEQQEAPAPKVKEEEPPV